MGLYKKFHINENITVGLWQLEEDLDTLLDLIDHNIYETAVINSFKKEARKKQWLATRVLLNQLNKNHKISYLTSGKPILDDAFLSISHSEDKIAIAINEIDEIGIDIQKITPKIERIKTRFLSDTERTWAEKDLTVMTMCWSIKETLYKIYGDGSIIFRDHIKIPEFNLETKSLIGSIFYNEKWNNFKLELKYTEDFTLSYTVD